MSFSGRVNKPSHSGGLLISFEGRPPRLGSNIRITGGKILGKVQTVIGPIDDGLIHIYPVADEINPLTAVGSPVEIAPRVKSSRNKIRKVNTRRESNRKFSRERRGNSRNKTKESRQGNYKKRKGTNNRRRDSTNRNSRNFKSGRNFKGRRRK